MDFVRYHSLGALMQTSEVNAWFISYGNEETPGFVTEHGIILQSLAHASERRSNAAYLRTCVIPDRSSDTPTFKIEQTGRIYVPTTDPANPFYGYRGLRFSETDDIRLIKALLAGGAITGTEII